MNNNYEIYNKVWADAAKRDAGYINVSGGCRWIDARIGDMIKRNHLQEKVANIVDVGSGDGSRIYHVMRHFPGASLKGYDFSESAVASANKKYGSDRIRFYCSDVTKDNMAGGADLVTAFGVLEHIDDWKYFIESLISLGGVDQDIY